MLAFAGVVMFMFGALVHYWFNMRNPAIACFELSDAPAPAEALRHSSVTWWPVGIRCEYASGPDPLVFQSDWTLTVVLLVGLALVFTAVAIWRASARYSTEGKG